MQVSNYLIERGVYPLRQIRRSINCLTPIFYYWDFGDGTTSTEASPAHIYENEGRYDISLRILTTDVCIDTVYFNGDRLVKANALPIADFKVNKNTVSSFDPVVKFTDQSIGSVRCKLELGDGNFSELCDFTYSYRDTGYYKVDQIAYSKEGCTDTVSDIIRIRPELLFYAPNAFTPSGDGINESYRPSVFGASKYHFRILNRWGELMYETRNISSGWNGEVKSGKQAPVDSYIYYVEVFDADGKEHQYRGVFSLLR